MSGGGDEIKETAAEKAAAEIAVAQWEHFHNSGFKDIENRFIEAVQLDDGDAEVMRGRAAGSVGAAFDAAEGQALEQQRQAGVAPGAGRYAATLSDLATGRAASQSQALVATNEAVKDKTAQGIDAAISLGRGQAKEAQLGLEGVAGQAARQATSDAVTAVQKRALTQHGLGLAAGAGTAHLNKDK